MKEAHRFFKQPEGKTNKHPQLHFTLSDGVLNLIAPVDEVEVKEFNKEYSDLLKLL